MSTPILPLSARDRVNFYTNEMNVVLDIVEQVARLVPLEVLDELGHASKRMEQARAWDASDRELADCAQALDNARDLVPGMSLNLLVATRDEATDLAHHILRAVYVSQAVSA